jgi:histone acetyltransferase 1
MLILLRLDPADHRAVRAYRLQVKERLYRFNFVRIYVPLYILFCLSLNGGIQEVLAQLDKQERLQKLEETFQSVREDYLRILAMIR